MRVVNIRISCCISKIPECGNLDDLNPMRKRVGHKTMEDFDFQTTFWKRLIKWNMFLQSEKNPNYHLWKIVKRTHWNPEIKLQLKSHCKLLHGTKTQNQFSNKFRVLLCKYSLGKTYQCHNLHRTNARKYELMKNSKSSEIELKWENDNEKKS